MGSGDFRSLPPARRYYSLGVQTKEGRLLLRDILSRNARLHPARVAFSFEGTELTWIDFRRKVRVCAGLLRGMGVRRGDRVALLARNTPEYTVILFATTQIGGVIVPVNHLLVAREVLEIISDSDARLLLFASEFHPLINDLRAATGHTMKFASIDGELAEGIPHLPTLSVGAAELRTGTVPLVDGDIAMQVYATNPSGKARGALLSHRNLTAAAAAGALELSLTPDDVYLSCHPFPFLAGAGRQMRFLYVGGRIVMLRDFSPVDALRAIERQCVTHAFFTPTMLARILDLPSDRRFNLGTLRIVMYGGAIIPLDLLKKAIRHFGCGFVQLHGSVESSGNMTVLHANDHRLDDDAPYMRKLMSIGKETYGVKVRVLDENRKETPPMTIGEISVSGDTVFSGYYKDADATAAVLSSGWLKTGEVASIDEEGYIYVVDRTRDALMVGGLLVDPREVESVILMHPSVREAAVIGRTDYELGEVPVAIVVLKDGDETDAAAMLDHCRRNMASFKVPAAVEFAPSLPRNAQGKVLKAMLRETPTPNRFRR